MLDDDDLPTEDLPVPGSMPQVTGPDATMCPDETQGREEFWKSTECEWVLL